MFNYRQTNLDEVEFVSVAPMDELPNGERLFVEIDNESLVIFNIAGQYFAIGDVCTHDYGPLGDGEMDGHQVACPRHGATFDVRTGKATGLPAIIDIPAYPTRVVGGMIEVGLPVSR